jgi:protein tyrosine phosphatase
MDIDNVDIEIIKSVAAIVNKNVLEVLFKLFGITTKSLKIVKAYINSINNTEEAQNTYLTIIKTPALRNSDTMRLAYGNWADLSLSEVMEAIKINEVRDAFNKAPADSPAQKLALEKLCDEITLREKH